MRNIFLLVIFVIFVCWWSFFDSNFIFFIHDFFYPISNNFLDWFYILSDNNYWITQWIQIWSLLFQNILNIILYKLNVPFNLRPVSNLLLLIFLYLYFWYKWFKKLFEYFNIKLVVSDSIIVLLFYYLNLFIFININTGIFYSIWFALSYSLQPLIFYYLNKVFDSFKIKDIIILIIYMLLASNWIQILFATILVFMLYIFTFRVRDIFTVFKSFFKIYKIILLIVLFLIWFSYYIIPSWFEIIFNISQWSKNITEIWSMAWSMRWWLLYMFHNYFSRALYNDRSPKNILTFFDYFSWNRFRALSIISYIPILLLFFIKNTKVKQAFIWFIFIILIALFFAKWSQYPLWSIYSWLLDNVPFFSIVRTPDTKFWAPFMFWITSIIWILLHIYKSRARRPIIIYLVIISVPLFTWEVFNGRNELNKSTKYLHDYPIDYQKGIDEINSLNYSYSCLSYPEWFFGTYNSWSWTYIWVDLFWEKLSFPMISYFYNIPNNIIKRDLRSIIEWNLDLGILYKLNIWCILIRKNIHWSNQKKIKDFSNEIKKTKKYDLLYSWSLIEIFMSKTNIVSIIRHTSARLTFSKINPTKYRLNLTIPSTSTGQELSFLQSYHRERKLYPGQPITDCTKQQSYNSYTQTGSYITWVTHIVQPRQTLATIARQYSTISGYLSILNTLSTPRLSSWQVLQIVPESYPEMIQTATGNITECIQSGYTFWQGEELSYLRRQPLRESGHSMIYDYANTRKISLSTISPSWETYLQQWLRQGWITRNTDWSYDVSLVLYFRPQSRFYLWLGISWATFLSLILWLLRDYRRRKSLEISSKGDMLN